MIGKFRGKIVAAWLIAMSFLLVIAGGIMAMRFPHGSISWGTHTLGNQWLGGAALTAGAGFYFVGRLFLFFSKMKRK